MKKALFLSIFVMLISIAAKAQTTVNYIDKNGTLKSQEATSITTSSTSWSDGWYVVDDDVEITTPITISGDVHLILADGKTLTSSQGIIVSSGYSLTIYAQSTGTGAGSIDATGYAGSAGIGGVSNYYTGDITIVGGNITATGNGDAADIGCGDHGYYGKIVILGGNISATTIGDWKDGYSCRVIVKNGVVSSTAINAEDGNLIAGFDYTDGNMLFYKIDATSVAVGDGTHRAWIGDDDINEITIPASVKIGETSYAVSKIAASAFGSMSGLKTVIFPTTDNQITSIGEGAFSNSENLKTINLEACTNLTEICGTAFYYTMLYGDDISIKIPAKVETIGPNAFEICTKLKSVEFLGDENLKSIGEAAFHQCSLTEITLPSSIQKIGAGAFNDQQTIESGTNETGPFVLTIRATTPPTLDGDPFDSDVPAAKRLLIVPPCAANAYADAWGTEYFGSNITGFVAFDEADLQNTYVKTYDGNTSLIEFDPPITINATNATLTFTALEFLNKNVEMDGDNYKAKPLKAIYKLEYDDNNGTSCNDDNQVVFLKDVKGTIEPYTIKGSEIAPVVANMKMPDGDSYAFAPNYISGNGKLDGSTKVEITTTLGETISFYLIAQFYDGSGSPVLYAGSGYSIKVSIYSGYPDIYDSKGFATHNFVLPDGVLINSNCAIGGNIYAINDGTTLTIKYGDGSSIEGADFYKDNDDDHPGWSDETPMYPNITTVIFDESLKAVRPVRLNYWFDNFPNLTTFVGWENLNTSEVTSMVAVFRGCTSLQTLNLSTFNTKKVENVTEMFKGCSRLTTIYVNSNSSEYWDNSQMNTSSDMFSGCTSLVGGKGTTYSGSNVDASRAIIDEGPESYNPGYLTSDKTLGYAVFDDNNGALTFYAGNKPVIPNCYVLNETGTTPGWITNHAADIKKVSFSYYFDEVNVTSCYQWFAGCSNLQEIESIVDYFKTDNVTSFYEMFKGCSKLIHLRLERFNTASAADFTSMFNGCSSLTTIFVDDSKWSVSSTASSSNMFTGCTSLIGNYGAWVGTTTDATYAYAKKTDPDDKDGYLTDFPFKIFYDYDGGAVSGEQTVEYRFSGLWEGAIKEPTRSGYAFGGWQRENPQGTFTDVEMSTLIDSPYDKIGNMKLKAKWKHIITLPSTDWTATDASRNTITSAAEGDIVTLIYTGTEKIKKVEVFPILQSFTITSSSTLPLHVNGTTTLSCDNFSPEGVAEEDKVVTWSSSDANVATVDSEGNVTAVAVGTTTITAETADGKTATIEITVEE